MTADAFEAAAAEVAQTRLAALRDLGYADAAALPWASIEDIVIAGKEVQLTVFQQTGLPQAPEEILVTVQLTRAGLGGTVNFQLERGLVFSPDHTVREAADAELEATR